MDNCDDYFLGLGRASLPFVTLGAIFLVSLFPTSGLGFNHILATSDLSLTIPVYMMTTRGNTEQPQGIQGPGYNNNYQLLDINQLLESCPPETLVFVHGWGIDQNKAKERLDRVKMSFEYNRYIIPVVGFSWDSNMAWLPAKLVAKENGPRLADFVLDYMKACKEEHGRIVDVRLLGHSMGARVILSSLDTLHANNTWKSNKFQITSVDLLGAAVDNEEVSIQSIEHYNRPMWLHDFNGVKFPYGKAIEDEVLQFSNLHSSDDNVFERYYPNYEVGDRALAENGKQTDPEVPTPSNYADIEVQSQLGAIEDADAIDGCDFGICELGLEAHVGDNHAGYIGFRNLTNTSLLADDGALDVVVSNWSSHILAPSFVN
jgi:pimeloyl-ACP methyl ester carboxylesterase